MGTFKPQKKCISKFPTEKTQIIFLLQYFILKFLCGKARKHTKDDDYDYGKGDKNDVFGEPKKGRKKLKMKKEGTQTESSCFKGNSECCRRCKFICAHPGKNGVSSKYSLCTSESCLECTKSMIIGMSIFLSIFASICCHAKPV